MIFGELVKNRQLLDIRRLIFLKDSKHVLNKTCYNHVILTWFNNFKNKLQKNNNI